MADYTEIPGSSIPAMNKIGLPSQGNVPDFNKDLSIPSWGYGFGDIPKYQRASGSDLTGYQNQNFNFQFDPNNDPSYQWRFQQGQQATERQLAASGNRFSGGGMLALQQYGQGAASQEYQNQYQRALQSYITNQGERQFTYNSGYQNAQTNYQRGVEEYGLNRGAESELFGRKQFVYGTDVNKALQEYQGAMSKYQLNFAAEQSKYQRGVTNYQLAYGAQQDFLNRLASGASMMPTMGYPNIGSTYMQQADAMGNLYGQGANLSLAQSQGATNNLFGLAGLGLTAYSTFKGGGI